MSRFNVVRLILGKDEPGDTASDDKYTRASSYLRSWVDDGVLKRTSRPAVYPYELVFHLGGGRRRVRGIIAEVALEAWGGSIIPHERTFPGPIEDRLKLIRAVRANLSPIYAVLAGGPGSADLRAFLDEVTATSPARETTDEVGTRHRLWVWDAAPAEVTASLNGRSLMIADGHHRYAVALAHREEMRARAGPGPWDYAMMFIVDAAMEDPPVLPIHRAVLGRARPTLGGERVRDLAEVLATLHDDHLTYGVAHLEEGEMVHRVAGLEGAPPTVCALHERLLDRIPGIELRFVPEAVAAEALVSAGRSTVAYLLPPTKVERVWDVVSRGGKLPQKSTYFWPKPRTGLVIRPLSP